MSRGSLVPRLQENWLRSRSSGPHRWRSESLRGSSRLDLKKSILEIIQNQKLIELFGSEGEERAKNKFSLQEYVNNFKAFYNSF